MTRPPTRRELLEEVALDAWEAWLARRSDGFQPAFGAPCPDGFSRVQASPDDDDAVRRDFAPTLQRAKAALARADANDAPVPAPAPDAPGRDATASWRL